MVGASWNRQVETVEALPAFSDSEESFLVRRVLVTEECWK
jgi:hypothetical protein